MIKILNVAGARPNFMKVAPLISAMDVIGGFDHRLVHTGQHYDAAMSQVFFDDLGIPRPHVNLEVGPGERLAQIERIMQKFDPVVRVCRPDAVLVVGDVNSTVACARVAKQHGIAVVHVEAGLRSFDRSMPEELNRIETDQLSDLLFVTEKSGVDNLAREGIEGGVFLVGNVMIDTLVRKLPQARSLELFRQFDVLPKSYVVATFHRPSNVDTVEGLKALIEVLEHVAVRLPVVLPMHPRTRTSLGQHGLLERLLAIPNVHATHPLGYLEFLSLVADSTVVITDSGGIQEETTFLQIPCVTMRDNTERPVTVTVGSNVLAGSSPDGVKRAFDRVMRCGSRGDVPALWDGRASERIAEILRSELPR